MNQFLLKKGCSELVPFTQIIAFAQKKSARIHHDALQPAATNTLRIYFIIEGKFEWIVDNEPYTLYPGDLSIILPWQVVTGEENVVNMGAICWLYIVLDVLETTEDLVIGNWSGLSKSETNAIGKILTFNHTPVLSAQKEAGILLGQMEQEIFNQEIGYITRVNQLLDELLVKSARQLTRQNNQRRDFPQSFLVLEQTLRKNLSHQWTVEEMAALIGLGNTSFSEKVKSFTGFSPLNYLINIRISEALKLLKKPHVHVTDIALTVGFYSSQHFATTFKKLTGYTPSEFRKKNIINP